MDLPAGRRTAIADAMNFALGVRRAYLDLACDGMLSLANTAAAKACVDARGDPDELADPALQEVASRQVAQPKVLEPDLERYPASTAYSTVTDFARLRGWSASLPMMTAVW